MPKETVNQNWYDYYNYELADVRTRDFLLIRQPIIIVSIVAIYIYVVLSLGPKFMKNRPPLVLKKVLLLYNFFQVILSAYIFLGTLEFVVRHKFSFRCQPIDYSQSPSAMDESFGAYIFLLAKISELLDTIFFVLRKKNSQVTFLHVYHHAMMPLYSWFFVKYVPGGHNFLIPLLNGFVHVVMYFYYMVAAAGPQYQKYLWWKKYITKLQLAQFVWGIPHNLQLLFYDCDFPKWTLFITIPNAILFFVLFYRFHKKTYKVSTKTKGE